MSELLIVIDNEVTEVTGIHDNGFGGFCIDCDNGAEYQVFSDHDAAGKAAKEYWEDMKDNDKEEFKCLVGTDNILAWAMGEYAGSGSNQVNSMEDWFDLWLDTPEEQWASYDGEEIEGAAFNKNFENETGFDDRDFIVFYRCN